MTISSRTDAKDKGVDVRGQGFKRIAEILADLVTKGATPYKIEMFAFDRFKKVEPGRLRSELVLVSLHAGV